MFTIVHSKILVEHLKLGQTLDWLIKGMNGTCWIDRRHCVSIKLLHLAFRIILTDCSPEAQLQYEHTETLTMQLCLQVSLLCLQSSFSLNWTGCQLGCEWYHSCFDLEKYSNLSPCVISFDLIYSTKWVSTSCLHRNTHTETDRHTNKSK